MSPSLLIAVLLAAYVFGSIIYVYRLRGRVRYASFSQYLRKSWPIFAPINCLLYMTTRGYARGAVPNPDIIAGVEHIRANWQRIRDEALALRAAGELDRTSAPGAAGYHDLGFRTFYKRGWKKFYLKWYGAAHPSARRLCPETVAIIEQAPGIRAAMFSLLPAGSELTLHADPLACSLRYHLGLSTPNKDTCYISVDLEHLSWRDGEDFVFDETYPHYARNPTTHDRLILMCDVERPMHLPGRMVNAVYALVAKGLRVPNEEGDPRGVITRLFGAVAPVQAFGQRLKARNRQTYVLVKVLFNLMIVGVALYPLWWALCMLDQVAA